MQRGKLSEMAGETLTNIKQVKKRGEKITSIRSKLSSKKLFHLNDSDLHRATLLCIVLAK